MSNLSFIQTMERDIEDKMDAEVSNQEDELRMEIDQLINRFASASSEDVMLEIKKENGWDLSADETAYSELYSELEEKMRNRLGMR